jgi:gluconolactonase
MVYFQRHHLLARLPREDRRIEAGHIWKFDPTTRKTSVFRSPSGMSNGIKFDAAGNMIVAEGADYGGRRVTRTDMAPARAKSWPAFRGRPFNSPNDITIDEKGRIYFSDPRYLDMSRSSSRDGRLPDRPDRTIHRVITGRRKAQRRLLSPDQKTLYVVSNDNGSTGLDGSPRTRRCTRADGAPRVRRRGRRTGKFRKTLVGLCPAGRPRRPVCDVDGNLYVAVRDVTRPGIYVYSPEGKELAYVATEVRRT